MPPRLSQHLSHVHCLPFPFCTDACTHRRVRNARQRRRLARTAVGMSGAVACRPLDGPVACMPPVPALTTAPGGPDGAPPSTPPPISPPPVLASSSSFSPVDLPGGPQEAAVRQSYAWAASRACLVVSPASARTLTSKATPVARTARRTRRRAAGDRTGRRCSQADRGRRGRRPRASHHGPRRSTHAWPGSQRVWDAGLRAKNAALHR